MGSFIRDDHDIQVPVPVLGAQLSGGDISKWPGLWLTRGAR